MTELKQFFVGKGQVKGFTFTQLEKNKAGYIYEVNTGNSIHYEVFKRRENSQFNCVSYPGNKSFGIWAWTCSSLDKAQEKLAELDILLESKIS